jgi:hypothetical protein
MNFTSPRRWRRRCSTRGGGLHLLDQRQFGLHGGHVGQGLQLAGDLDHPVAQLCKHALLAQ